MNALALTTDSSLVAGVRCARSQCRCRVQTNCCHWRVLQVEKHLKAEIRLQRARLQTKRGGFRLGGPSRSTRLGRVAQVLASPALSPTGRLESAPPLSPAQHIMFLASGRWASRVARSASESGKYAEAKGRVSSTTKETTLDAVVPARREGRIGPRIHQPTFISRNLLAPA